jgi:hypothetical protein
MIARCKAPAGDFRNKWKMIAATTARLRSMPPIRNAYNYKQVGYYIRETKPESDPRNVSKSLLRSG